MEKILVEPGLMCLGTVINVFESVDVITLIKGGIYDELGLSVGEALLKRQDVGLSNVSRI
jgi:hypothetical protein